MRTLTLTLTPEEYHTPDLFRAATARQAAVNADQIAHIQVLRRSIDSRRGVHYQLNVQILFHGEPLPESPTPSRYLESSNATPVVIVGTGPAGLFAALRALEVGLRPILVERGSPVELRKKELTAMVRHNEVNPESNWCFGEGGAGTFSDGKLYTRSTKRGDVGDVLRKFVEHGADPDILIDTHAHIGTDRLHTLISNMRRTIEEHGGEYHFHSCVDDLLIREGRVCGVHCADGSIFEGCAVILATGHSARDIYRLFHNRGWALQAKPFALGVRVEHPQQLINQIQYHSKQPSPFLPPAAYSLTTQVAGHGVFSFCMCPGGVIVPAATAPGEHVVNGMSNASRSSAFANSGIAVTVGLEDVPQYADRGPLALLEFQREIERQMCRATGGGLTAPGQRLTDFCQGRPSRQLNRTNYMGPVAALPLHEILPPFVVNALQQGFLDFGRKMHGFYTEQASLLAVESRTSSPVRIPRDPETLQHPQLPGLYPVGEGAGYAGGIVSSALDGIRAMTLLAEQTIHPQRHTTE